MHNHSHSAPQENMGPKYLWGIALNLTFVAVEFGYGLKINSLSLLADAWHNLGDVAGLVISLVAFTMAAKLTPASAAMCKKADRELSSLLLMKSRAVNVLITTPMPATQLTVLPIVGSGWENRT